MKYSMIVDKDTKVVGWRRGVMVDGDNCGLLCVEGSIGCAVECGGMVWIVVGVVGKM